MERLHLTYEQAMNEPIEVINRAFVIWELDAKRDKLKSGSNN
jgi:hypothetical protein